jgi:hypothetical protein
MLALPSKRSGERREAPDQCDCHQAVGQRASCPGDVLFGDVAVVIGDPALLAAVAEQAQTRAPLKKPPPSVYSAGIELGLTRLAKPGRGWKLLWCRGCNE